jgi:hypothetical protein
LKASREGGLGRPGWGRGCESIFRYTIESAIGSFGADRSQALTVKMRPFQRTGCPTRASNRSVSAVTLSSACNTAML